MYISAHNAKLVAESNCPANIISNPELINLLTTGHLHLKVPCPNTIQRDVKVMYVNCYGHISKLFQDHPRLVLRWLALMGQISRYWQLRSLSVGRGSTGFWSALYAQIFSNFYLFYLIFYKSKKREPLQHYPRHVHFATDAWMSPNHHTFIA
jgi:hypothetical protein